MGIFFEVKGKTAEFKLEDYEVRGYEFSYAVPDSSIKIHHITAEKSLHILI